MVTLGLILLPSICACAQPADPPTPRQRAEQEMEKRLDATQARLRAQMMAPPPLEVQSRALSPDGKVAVSCGSDGKITLWDARTGQDLRVIQAYDATRYLDSFSSAAFSPNGKWLFTVGKVKQQVELGAAAQIVTVEGARTTTETTQAKLWDVATGQLVWTLPQMNDGMKWSTAVNTVAWSFDSKMLATKARYGPVHLWDASSAKLLRTLRVPFMEMNALAFSPDGQILAGNGHHNPSYSSEIILWDVASGELQRSLKQPENSLGNQILVLKFSPDGKTLASGGGVGRYERINEWSGRFNTQSGVIQLWDVKSGILLLVSDARCIAAWSRRWRFHPMGRGSQVAAKITPSDYGMPSRGFRWQKPLATAMKRKKSPPRTKRANQAFSAPRSSRSRSVER